MREGNFYQASELYFDEGNEYIFNEITEDTEFNFGDELHRDVLIDDPSFTYGHYRIDQGYATVGGVRLGNKLYYSVSFCSPKDNFSKREGREYVQEHMFDPEQSHKRGVMILDEQTIDFPPAQLFKFALEHHINKMRHRPWWMRHKQVDFRKPQRQR